MSQMPISLKISYNTPRGAFTTLTVLVLRQVNMDIQK